MLAANKTALHSNHSKSRAVECIHLARTEDQQSNVTLLTLSLTEGAGYSPCFTFLSLASCLYLLGSHRLPLTSIKYKKQQRRLARDTRPLVSARIFLKLASRFARAKVSTLVKGSWDQR